MCLQTFLGNRYGHRPLQVTIPSKEFDILHGFVKERSLEEADLLSQWYQQDSNALPPVYTLQVGLCINTLWSPGLKRLNQQTFFMHLASIYMI